MIGRWNVLLKRSHFSEHVTLRFFFHSNGKWTRIEDVFPIEKVDNPASYVSLPEGHFLGPGIKFAGSPPHPPTPRSLNSLGGAMALAWLDTLTFVPGGQELHHSWSAHWGFPDFLLGRKKNLGIFSRRKTKTLGLKESQNSGFLGKSKFAKK